MMLGKRARPPMKRTTSMTEFTLGFNAEYQQQFLNPFNGGGGGGLDHQLLGSTAAPQRRNSGDFSETANFLRVCSLCKRRLVPGRDIYMYRGDTAFCSLECRQQQMTQDERKEKCSLASKTKETAAAAATTTTTTTTAAGGAQVSATG